VAQLTYDQVKALWIKNGGNPTVAPLAAGFAYGESRFNTDAVNQQGSPDYGLWQLTYAGTLGPDRTRKYGTPQQLMADPDLQARAVIAEYGPSLELSKIGFGGKPGHPETADVIYQIWQGWNGGTQQAPPDDVVRRWIGSTLSAPASGGPAGEAPNVVADGSTTLAGGGGPAAEKVGCNTGSKGFSFETPGIIGNFGSQTIANGLGNACQLKALAGGLLVGVGFSLFVTGAILVAMNTRTGSKVAGAAAGILPGGSALKRVGGSGSRFPRVTAETEAESRANYDARNPSPARIEATRRARSGNLGAVSYSMDDLASDLFRFE